MTSRSLLFLLPLLVLLAQPLTAKEKEKKEKPVTYSVIQTDVESFEACPDKDVKKRKKEAGDQYKQAVKDWTKAKKEAAKNKEKFTEPKPKAPMFKIVAKGLKGEGEAQAKIEAIMEAIRKAKEKKGPEKGGKQPKK